jgi:hypothetical protein
MVGEADEDRGISDVIARRSPPRIAEKGSIHPSPRPSTEDPAPRFLLPIRHRAIPHGDTVGIGIVPRVKERRHMSVLLPLSVPLAGNEPPHTAGRCPHPYLQGMRRSGAGLGGMMVALRFWGALPAAAAPIAIRVVEITRPPVDGSKGRPPM